MRRPLALLVLCSLVAALASCAAKETSPDCLLEGSAGCRQSDLSGLNLSGRDLSGYDFSGANLSGSNFSGAVMVGTVLAHADLRNAVFDQAILKRASLFNALATGTSWTGADLEEADLEGTDLRRADLVGSSLVNARLHDVNLSYGSLAEADLSGALLANVYLGEVDLSRANLSNAVVTGTSLRDTLLEDVVWDGALLRREDGPPAVISTLGAVICTDTSCDGVPVRGSFPVLGVSAETFRVVSSAMARFGMVNGEGPTVVSRSLALSFMAAYGVYPDAADTPLLSWDPVPYDGAEAVQDVAAVVAAYSAGIFVRRNPGGTMLDGRMGGFIFSRDVTLWELTRQAPQARGLVAAAAADSTRRVMLRASVDGFADRSTTFVPTGAWEPTPPAFAPGLEAGWGGLLRYRNGSERCAAPAPRIDPLTGANEARLIADAASAAQRSAARFWDDERIRTPTPPGHWVLIAAQVLDEEISTGRSTVKGGFATMLDVSVAMADTLIQVWSDKYRYQTARPITIIAATDPNWNSYLSNPPFPAYPSGHAAISRAAADILTENLGSRPFEDTRGNESAGAWLMLNITPRSFDNFSHAAEEAGLSRVWAGIHVMEDYHGAVHIGKCVARLGGRASER